MCNYLFTTYLQTCAHQTYMIPLCLKDCRRSNMKKNFPLGKNKRSTSSFQMETKNVVQIAILFYQATCDILLILISRGKTSRMADTDF